MILFWFHFGWLIIKQDYKNKYLDTGDWNPSNGTHVTKTKASVIDRGMNINFTHCDIDNDKEM